MSAYCVDELPPLALLAGGLATRLRPLTETIAKSMVEVAGEPFIAHQMRLLRRKGIDRAVICIGHLGEAIERFVGDGARFGLRVAYSRDGARPLGTGGALRRALPQLGEKFFVMYGDSYLDADFAAVAAAFRRSGAPALMTVFRNDGKWDKSNVAYRDGMIERYDKSAAPGEMAYIDYGLGVIAAEALAARPSGVPFDLADFYAALAREGRLAGFEVAGRFYEIGAPAGLAETSAYLAALAAARSRP
jgi:NDP-sugar pyrophosphorylase family protein